jgi:hypothetical protein
MSPEVQFLDLRSNRVLDTSRKSQFLGERGFNEVCSDIATNLCNAVCHLEKNVVLVVPPKRILNISNYLQSSNLEGKLQRESKRPQTGQQHMAQYTREKAKHKQKVEGILERAGRGVLYPAPCGSESRLSSKCSQVQWTKLGGASPSCLPCGLLTGPCMLRPWPEPPYLYCPRRFTFRSCTKL